MTLTEKAKNPVYWRGNYFITRALLHVNLLYSLSKRKFIKPASVTSGEIEYMVYPGRYVLFAVYWERGWDCVIICTRVVRIEREQGIKARKTDEWDKSACIKFREKSTLFASDAPQQVKDVMKMVALPPNMKLFRIVYDEKEHEKLMSLIHARKGIDLTSRT